MASGRTTESPDPSDTGARRIHALGQAIWLQGFRRRLIDSGRAAALIRDAGLGGLTTDFTLLAGSVARGGEYASVLRTHAEGDSTTADVQRRLLVEEAAVAAAALAPVHAASGGVDGFVGIEVDPALAHDAESMARAARHLLAIDGAANVMPSLPASNSGFAVFETLVADGLPAQIGPVFTLRSAMRAAKAFDRGAAGAERMSTAVVSFAIAPLDNLVDQLLHREIRAVPRDMSAVESLLGGAGVATAKLVWRRMGERRGAEASRLRIAWTGLVSTDPRQPRHHYVEQLVGPGTIAILDATLLEGLLRRGEIEATLGRRVDDAGDLLGELQELGIDVEEVGSALEAKALRRARAAHEQFSAAVERAAGAIVREPRAAARRAAHGVPWWGRTTEIDDALIDTAELERRDAVARLWSKDATLWSEEAEAAELIRNRLGWLDVAASPAADPDAMLGFVAELGAGEVESVILLGMGGSSLTAEVCRDIFRTDRVRVLDSTVPSHIRSIAGQVDPARTVVVVASKSGTTVEVRALFDWFYALATPMLDRPGERFAAITDPGTPLEQLAHERRFRRLWLAPSDVGGRFSGLTVFGTLPLALMEVDVQRVLDAARRMAAACAPEVEPAANPAARLAGALYRAHGRRRDKLTIITSPRLAGFALWIEQLVAESTGKQGTGLIPVVDEPEVDVDDYGDDRLFVALSLRDDDLDEHRSRVDELVAAGLPALHFELDDAHEIGAEMFRWEAAVALLGALLGINPFDQPDVQASKDRTAALLATDHEDDPLWERQPLATDAGWTIFADIERDEELAARLKGDGLRAWLAAHLGRAENGEYVALQAFLPPDDDVHESLQELRALLAEQLGVATTLGWGPAFLHSTGQLHKGGPDTGLFLQLTADVDEDIDVPGAGYTFARLLRAQSLGDLAALEERGRRVVRVHLRDPAPGCHILLQAAEDAFG